jgi:kynurenine formamidase
MNGRAAVVLSIAVFGLAGCRSLSPDLASLQIVDLTHAFDTETIYWPTEEGFVLDVGFSGTTDAGYFYAANSFRSAEHGGTHIDAPVHFAEGRWTVDEIPLDRLVGPGAVIDVRDRCAGDADYEIRVEDLMRWESEHGEIRPGSIVLLRTGYSQYWPDRERYLGTSTRGAAAVAQDRRRAGRRRRGTRHAEHRLRPVEALRIPPHPLRSRHPRLRERREPRRAAPDRLPGRRAADEDSRWDRRALEDHRVGAGAHRGLSRIVAFVAVTDSVRVARPLPVTDGLFGVWIPNSQDPPFREHRQKKLLFRYIGSV